MVQTAHILLRKRLQRVLMLWSLRVITIEAFALPDKSLGMIAIIMKALCAQVNHGRILAAIGQVVNDPREYHVKLETRLKDSKTRWSEGIVWCLFWPWSSPTDIRGCQTQLRGYLRPMRAKTWNPISVRRRNKHINL